MDDSDQDFVDLCSNFKLPKRVVRRKPNETTAAPRSTAQLQPSSSTQSRDTSKRKILQSKRCKRDVESAASSKALPNEEREAIQTDVKNGSVGRVSGDMGPPVSAGSGESKASNIVSEKGAGAKEKVLFRMQQFKRVSPQKMMHSEKNPSRGTESEHDIGPQSVQIEIPGPSSGGLPDSDEALALRLQQELDREAVDAQAVDLEDRGLFFCQLCNRDLSHMTAEGRTQHINRCLDESEDSAPAPPPPPSVPNCPICGKRFKSQKSRSVHLKRCSSDMGVAPAVLLQVLQRQATEAHSDGGVANPAGQTVSTKRKGSTEPDMPARKRRKPKKKTQPLDEDTIVALALSSSLMERMKEEQRQRETEREIQRQTAAPHTSVPPLLRWKPDAGKGRGKRKKDGVPRPPPLLLVQDAETALRRLQERVAVLLLCGPASSPPTPTRCPSSLSARSRAAPLWHKSQLRDGGPSCLSEFYTPELGEFIVAWKSTETEMSSNKGNPESLICPPSREGTPLTMTESPAVPSSSQTVTTPGTGPLPVGSQVLRDLIELADEGMTLSQWGYAPTRPAKAPDLQVSGFVPEEPAEQADLHLSGFLPETTTTHSHAPSSASQRQPGVPTAKWTHKSEPLSRLASDLSCMVNNPQLSDVQIQVDTGEVYFAHSFMLYARCPLLAQMVHDSGFGVKEEDMPAAQRVLLGDVPGQAVHCLLHYLYTGHCPVTASLRPHVLELASRFDLEDLRLLCELYSSHTENEGEGAGEGESWEDGPGQEHQPGVEEAFQELLRSMWTEEDQDDDETGGDGERDGDAEPDEGRRAGLVTPGDGEMPDEHVNEEEIEEIYEFAATQRKREEESGEGDLDSETERDDDIVRPVVPEPQRGSMGTEEKSPHGSPRCDPNTSLDRSYNRLFSESWGAYEEDSSSQKHEKQNAGSQNRQRCPSPRKLASTTDQAGKRTERPCLQSSVSAIELIDISMSPPSSVSNLPVPGLSPAARSGAEVSGRGDVDVSDVRKAFFTDRPREDVSPKKESQGRLSIRSCNALASRPSSKEPELVVLSDSDEEMETGPAAVCSPRGPSPPSPYSSQHGHSYTQIKSLPKVSHRRSGVENSQESRHSNAPSSPVPDLDQPGLCSAGLDPSPMDCSPEVSWLIPATPDSPSRSTSTSSTQTHSSMRRSQLFPKNSSSSLSSSQSASPSRLSLKNRPCSSVSPLRLTGSEHVSRADGGADSSSHSPVCTVPPSPPFRPSSFARSQPLPLRQGDSIQGTPLHRHGPAYSSTPLSTDLPQPLALAAASPLLGDCDREASSRRGSALSQSPEKRALGTLHLSLSENPVSQPSSPHRCPQSPPGDIASSFSHTRCSSQSDRHEGSKAAEETGEKPERSEEGERVSEVEEKGTDTERLNDSAMSVKEEAEEADISECSFRQSFMDDPPMDFMDDSWGLNAGADGDVVPDVPSARFSLRLEDSGGASPLQRSAGGGEMESSTPTTTRSPRRRTQSPTHAGPSFTPSPPPHFSPATKAAVNASLLDSKIWDSWEEEEEEEEEALTLSQRVKPAAPFRTPVTSRSRKRLSLVPITPMPSYSDMDTPDLKNKLNRFGVRPLPKRQMVLKLKEIHQYTHQIAGSESENETPSKSLPTTSSSAALSTRPGSCAKAVTFKQPSTVSHDVNRHSEEDAEPLSASQGSNTSSTAASEDSERSNPELCLSSDGDSDGEVTASQATSRLQDRLQAVRSFILSDPALYSQILQYQPLVLSQLQARLKAAGIRLGAAKLLDYLDSQCITFTTAKPGRAAPTRRRARGQGTRGAARGGARGRKRGAATAVA